MLASLVISPTISVVIPTYGRDEVLVETVSQLLALDPPPDEVIVVDQSISHPSGVQEILDRWLSAGAIRYSKLPTPSIPRAMNEGLINSAGEVVLFLDDDIVPDPKLISAHRLGHQNLEVAAMAGRVIQPWQKGKDLTKQKGFHFASAEAAWIDQFMGGNVSVKRSIALALGGFDENFVRVAYNFETEFAYRLLSNGYRIRYEPTACIHHLKIARGGTRSFGEFLTTSGPDHAVGAYYCTLRTRRGARGLCDVIGRLTRSVMTRHHVRRPWWIPITLFAECRGLIWAVALFLRGPRYIENLPKGGAN